MSKFIYLSDSHYGANPPGYQQQRAYPELIPAIITALRNYIAEQSIDFVLHGGDLIDFTSEENIIESAKLFETLGVPSYLCLGNHDLTTSDSLSQWLKFAPQLFPGGKPEFSLLNDCAIHVIPNHWGQHSYYWEVSQETSFDEGQLKFIEQSLSANTDRPHILLTHSPVFALSAQQTGLKEEMHPPIGNLPQTIIDLAARHPHLSCVLGAHNHLNMCVEKNGTYFVTTSALHEVPFEVKQIEATQDSVSMTTVSLLSRIDAKTDYDFNKTFVQGREVDRTFVWSK
jgi:DNA repair exonuclease SbcCD nuclease subunit